MVAEKIDREIIKIVTLVKGKHTSVPVEIRDALGAPKDTNSKLEWRFDHETQTVTVKVADTPVNKLKALFNSSITVENEDNSDLDGTKE